LLGQFRLHAGGALLLQTEQFRTGQHGAVSRERTGKIVGRQQRVSELQTEDVQAGQIIDRIEVAAEQFETAAGGIGVFLLKLQGDQREGRIRPVGIPRGGREQFVQRIDRHVELVGLLRGHRAIHERLVAVGRGLFQRLENRHRSGELFLQRKRKTQHKAGVRSDLDRRLLAQ
jgi:hypothetical protein